MKNFGRLNFGDFFVSTRKKLYPILGQEENLKKIAESFYRSLATPDEMEIMLM